MKSRHFFRIVSLLLIVSLVGCSRTAIQTESEKQVPKQTATQEKYTDRPSVVRKNETVYVNIDSSGKVSAVNVTNHLHTDKPKVLVNDKSILKNIEDIKGYCVPEINGDSLTWNMEKTDLYYKGTTDKQLPVELEIKYYLDGKEQTAEKLAHKSGDIKIEVSMKNRCSTVDENGNKVFLPMIASGLMILPENTFSGIEVENGLCIGDGSKQMIVGIGFPGMAESLGSDETLTLGNMKMSESFAVTAHTEDFSLGNMYFALLPICSMSTDVAVPGSETEIRELISDMGSLVDVFGKIDLEALTGAMKDNPDAAQELTDSFSKAIGLYSENKELLDVLNEYLTDENIDSILKLTKILNDPDNAKALDMLKNPVVRSFMSDLPELLSTVDELTPLMTKLQEDMSDPKVKSALDSLPETLEALSGLQETLKENEALINTLTALASDELEEAIKILTQRLSDEETGTFLAEFSKNSDELMPRVQSWISFGKSYGLFSGCEETAEINMMMVYATPPIK